MQNGDLYRKLEDHECPLLLCLTWARDGLLRSLPACMNVYVYVCICCKTFFRRKKLVLADHVPGTQDYSGMSLEGLRTALHILSEVQKTFTILSASFFIHHYHKPFPLISTQEEEAAVKAIEHKFSELKEVATNDTWQPTTTTEIKNARKSIRRCASTCKT